MISGRLSLLWLRVFAIFLSHFRQCKVSMWKPDRTVSSFVFCKSAYIAVGYIACVVE
jgi:hypothetical protein